MMALVAAAAVVSGAWAPARPLATQQPRQEAPSRKERLRLLREQTWDITAMRIDAGDVRLDGQVNEPAWDRAEPVTNLYQGERNEGLPASEDTQIRLLYDQENLYVGFRCLDGQPELVRARSIFRDEWAGSDDLLLIMIDAYHGHQSAVQFVTNANGLVQDAFQNGETASTRNDNFDAVWDSRGRRTPTGFEVEVRIPFSSLRFDPMGPGEETVFGIGFKRNIRRKNEDAFWPFVGNDSTWYRPAELGHLRGLRDIRGGRHLQARPYALTGLSRDIALGVTNLRRAVGLDAKYGITSGLTADFTVNTDFAQEEVDVQQINLTRFSLFFPEKRQFFLEGEQMFRFGLPQEVDLVFTRRIGLAPGGEVVPIIGGARLTGRQGRASIGAMSLQTLRYGDIATENFSVVRIRKDVFSRSNIGVLFTATTRDGRSDRVIGVDAHFRFRRVWFVEGFAALENATGRTGASVAGHGQFRYDADRFSGGYQLLSVGDGFNPDVGFVKRPDSRRHTGDLRYSPRFTAGWIRQAHIKTTFNYVTDQRGSLETREQAVEISADSETGEQPAVSFTDRYEVLDVPFSIQHFVIPPGAYRSRVVSARFRTFHGRPARMTISAEHGGFWSGTRATLSIQGDYRVNTHLGFSGTYEWNRVDLPQGGQFGTHLVSGRVLLPFRNNLGVQSLLQYNNATGQLSANVRFRWIVRPGTDFFVVYTEIDEQWKPLRPQARSLSVKLNHLLTL